MVKYVNGLLFSPSLRQVVLLTKKRPAFLNGKLCAVGGHIEEGEIPIDAIAREFEEEAGVWIPQAAWLEYGLMNGEDWSINCFYAVSELYHKVQTMTDEPVKIYDVEDVLRMSIQEPERVSSDLVALIGTVMANRPRPCRAYFEY